MTERPIPARLLIPLAAMAVVALSACSSPRLNAGLSLGPDGLTVVPSISAGLGGGRISYSP